MSDKLDCPNDDYCRAKKRIDWLEAESKRLHNDYLEFAELGTDQFVTEKIGKLEARVAELEELRLDEDFEFLKQERQKTKLKEEVRIGKGIVEHFIRENEELKSEVCRLLSKTRDDER